MAEQETSDRNSFLVKLSRRDVYITNTVKCRPPENRNPDDDEINACSTYLDQQINLISPSVIVLLGKNCCRGTHEYFRANVISQRESPLIKGYTNPYVVFYHPAYLLSSPGVKKVKYGMIYYFEKID